MGINKTKHKKLWKVFSEFIRKRDGGICFTCGVRKEIREMQAGHFKHGVLDFDEMNINCQCIRCNHWLSGNLSVYAERLLKKYGLKKFNDLCNRAAYALKGEFYQDEWLDEKIAYYQKKLKNYD